MERTDKARAALVAKLEKAQSRLSIATGARKDKGLNIETAREAKARRAVETARTTLAAYDRQEG